MTFEEKVKEYNRGWNDGKTHVLDSVLGYMSNLPETPEIYRIKEYIRKEL